MSGRAWTASLPARLPANAHGAGLEARVPTGGAA